MLLSGTLLAVVSLLLLSPPGERTTERLQLPATTAAGRTADDNILNVAILGVGGKTHDGGQLADMVMLASIDLESASAVLLSIPRDLYLHLGDGSSMRINRALAPVQGEAADRYGTRIREVFASAFNIPVDHYLRLDFAAFTQAVDAVGGVDVTFDSPLHDASFADSYGILDLAAGRHHLDGWTALHVARSRKTSTHGDLDRAARQRAILIALRERLDAVDALANPTVLRQLFTAQHEHVQTDMGVIDLLRLYHTSRDMTLDDIETRGFEDSPEPLLAHASIGGAAVLIPQTGDFSRIRDFMQTTIASR